MKTKYRNALDVLHDDVTASLRQEDHIHLPIQSTYSPNIWVCEDCGRTNSSLIDYCRDCGTDKGGLEGYDLYVHAVY